jgi:hypothetical protein
MRNGRYSDESYDDRLKPLYEIPQDWNKNKSDLIDKQVQTGRILYRTSYKLVIYFN